MSSLGDLVTVCFATLTLLACGCAGDDAGPAPDASGGGGGADAVTEGGRSGGSTEGPPPQVSCAAAGECPGSDTHCATRTCAEGICGLDYVAAGSEIDLQTPGDCKRAVCDGAGAIVAEPHPEDLPYDVNDCTYGYCAGTEPIMLPVAGGTPCSAGECNSYGQCTGCSAPEECAGEDTFCLTRTCQAGICGYDLLPAGTPLPADSQVEGNCKSRVCDALGNQIDASDDGDLPVDGAECTADACTAGFKSNPPEPVGASCSEGGGQICNGVGGCVECLSDAYCDAPHQCVVSSGRCSLVSSWADAWGSDHWDRVRGLAIDGDGNTLMSGSYYGNGLDFGAGALPYDGAHRSFIVRRDASHALSWATSRLLAGVRVAAWGTASYFGGNRGDAKQATVGKLGASGSSAWERTIDGGYAASVAAGANRLAVAGTFASQLKFGTTTIAAKGSVDSFVAVYDAAGTLVWVAPTGVPGEAVRATDVAVDDVGNVIVVGTFGGTMTIGSVSLSGDPGSLFVLAYDAAGGLAWARSYGSLGVVSVMLPYTCPEVAASGSDVIVAGTLAADQPALDFGGGSLGAPDGADVFMATLDSAGQHLSSRLFSDFGDEVLLGLSATPDGGVLLSGVALFDFVVDGQSLENHAGQDSGLFFAKLSDTGTLELGRIISSGAWDPSFLAVQRSNSAVLVAGNVLVGAAVDSDTFVTGEMTYSDVFAAEYSQ